MCDDDIVWPSTRLQARVADADVHNALAPLLPLFHTALRRRRSTPPAHLAHRRTGPAVRLRVHQSFVRAGLTHPLRRLRDLCLLSRLRVIQLALPDNITELSFDAAPPHLSPISASVTALSLGYTPDQRWFSDWQRTDRAASCCQADPRAGSRLYGDEEREGQLTR